MKVGGRFCSVRRKDRIFLGHKPSALTAVAPRSSMLDIRLIRLPNANVPYLLASASKKSGSAVARNKFRRRVRMAFLEILKKRQGAVDNGFALWVRPSKWSPSGCLVEYREIEKQLEQSLNRLRNP